MPSMRQILRSRERISCWS